MGYIDSHAHLDDERFAADLNDVLDRARQAGVEKILSIGNGTQPADFQRTLELARQHSWIRAALGVHPHEAVKATDELLEELDGLAAAPSVVAWGEIGLDYHYDHSPPPVQQTVFRQQLGLAKARRLPVLIHCREAWDDCLAILEEEWSAELGGILHCFSGDLEQARRARALGFLISFAGNITFPRAENLRAVAQAVPPDRLLVETDCPYLAPQPMRGKRNEPAYVVETAAVLGRLHGMTAEQMGALTTANFNRFLGKSLESK